MAGGCQVLPGLFGVFVQGISFLSCIGTLIFKKYREKDQRTWFEFGLDSTKLLCGAGVIHIMNLLFAESLESKIATGDECDWYWMNVMLDVTVGVPIEYFLLVQLTAMIQVLLGSQRGQDFKSGSYKDSNGGIMYEKFLKQLVVWLIVVSGMKLCVLMLMILFAGPLEAITSYVLFPVSGHPYLKLLVVMTLTPVTMNSLQFWLADNFIRKQPEYDLVDGFKQQLLMVNAKTNGLDDVGTLTILG